MSKRIGFLAEWVLTLILTATSAGPAFGAARGDLPEVPTLLDALETAINSIKSFDVKIEVKTEVYFSEYSLENDKPRQTLTVYREPKTYLSRSRQWFSQGRRRIEKYDPQSGEVTEVHGSDNEVERVMLVPAHRGSITRAGGKGIDRGQDYQETFRTLCDGITTMHVLRGRHKPPVARREGRFIVLEVDPGPGASYGTDGFRVFADTTANFLPAKTETYRIRDGERQLLARTTVTERKTIGPGLHVPVKAVTEFFSVLKDFGRFQQVKHKATLTVDVSGSRWNEHIGEEAFRVAFPAGLFVIDEIRDVAFVVGKADPGKNLEDLAASASSIVTNIRPKPPAHSRAWVWWTAAGTITGAMIILGVLFSYRGRSPKATT